MGKTLKTGSILTPVLLGFILGAIAAPNPDEAYNECPQGPNPPFHIYAHPEDCSKFYLCAHGRNYPKVCQGDLLFSSTKKVCVFKGSEDDTCQNGVPSSSSSASSGGSNPDQTGSNDSPTQPPVPDVNPYEAKNRCPAIPGPYPFMYSDPDDCSKFFLCSHGRNFLKACQGDLHFSDTAQTCVARGSEFDTCEIEQIISRCRAGHVGVIPHPHVCQRYFDCSEPERQRNQYEPPYLPFEKECRYTEVFDEASGQCKKYSEARCGGISRPGKEYCDYLYTHCTGDPSVPNCKPCAQRPSCVGLPDGYNLHSAFPDSDFFVFCESGYWLGGNVQCPGQKGASGAELDLQRCVGVPY